MNMQCLLASRNEIVTSQWACPSFKYSLCLNYGQSNNVASLQHYLRDRNSTGNDFIVQPLSC